MGKAFLGVFPTSLCSKLKTIYYMTTTQNFRHIIQCQDIIIIIFNLYSMSQQQPNTPAPNKKQLEQYKELDKFLENKNYQRGLKTAEKLLKQIPEHAETHSMKAIFIHYLGREDEALVEAKQAVNISKMKSRRCWQNYGFLLRLKRDYQMALFAYNQARAQKPTEPVNKNDNTQMNILRQITNLQAQARDYNGFCQTRFETLKQKSNAVNNWIGLAMAYYLKGNYSQVLRTLESTTKLVYSNDDLKPPQKNNYNIFYCMVYRQAGNNEELYKQLKLREKNILDKVVYKEMLIDACIKLKKMEEAEELIKDLVTMFPDNTDYFEILRLIRGTPNEHQDLQKLYEGIAEKYKSRMASLLELSHIQSDEQLFKTKFQKFITPAFKKNIVSIFSEITLLYNTQNAHKWIGEVLQTFQTSLRSDIYPNGEKALSPTEFLWSLYFRSQHLALEFETLPLALKLINEAIDHTPSLVQLRMVKADILQKLHEHQQAIVIINQARQLDLADRYMNNICIKFQLRALKPELAEATMKSFMGTESTPYDLQNMWFQIEMARCFLHKGEYAPGLRHINFVQKQFEDMYEDQYDFHSYSLYRWALKQYVDLIRKSDDIYNDRRYMQASAIAIKYLMEYAVIKDQLPAPKEYADVSEGLDYGGVKYLSKLGDPYQQALKWAKNTISAKYVNKNNKDLNEIYFKAFGQTLKLLIHLDKPMLAFKAFKKLLKTNSNPKVMHLYKLKAFLYFEKVLAGGKLREITQQIIKSSLTTLLEGSTDAKSYNERVTKSWDKSPESILREQQAKLILSEGKRQEYIHLYQRLLNDESYPLKDALRLIHKLEFYRVVDETVKTKMNARYGGLTSYFTNWEKSIDEIKKEEWSEWWNERYRHEREKEDKEEQEAEKKLVEQKGKEEIKK